MNKVSKFLLTIVLAEASVLLVGPVIANVIDVVRIVTGQ